MTTLLAVKKNNRICIGADTLTILAGGRKQTASDLINSDKIIAHQSNYIGVDGNHSLYLALKDLLKQDKKKVSFATEEDVFKQICRWHHILKEKYDLIPSSEESDSFESSRFELLIVSGAGIFKTYELRSVQHFAKFYAVGSGSSYALGAMEALYDKELSAEKIAKEALQVAAQFDDATGLPGTFYTL